MILGISDKTSCRRKPSLPPASSAMRGSVRVHHIGSQIEAGIQPFGMMGGSVSEIAVCREHCGMVLPRCDPRGMARRRVDRGHERSRLIEHSWSASPARKASLTACRSRLIAINHYREVHILFRPTCNAKGAPVPLAGRVFLSLVVWAATLRSTTCEARRDNGCTSTRDDAIGETIRQGCESHGLPYPGGPQIEKFARDRSR